MSETIITDNGFGGNSGSVSSVVVANLLADRPVRSDASSMLVSGNIKLGEVSGLSDALRQKQYLDFQEQLTVAPPLAGNLRIYSKPDNQFYQKDSLGVETPLGGGGGGGGVIWDFSTTITMANPGAGNVRFDSTTPASVANIAISVESSSGSNYRPILQTLSAGDSILFADSTGTNSKLYTLTGSTDNTNWFQLGVSLESESVATNYADGDELGVSYFPSATPTNPFDQSLNTTDNVQFAKITTSRVEAPLTQLSLVAGAKSLTINETANLSTFNTEISATAASIGTSTISDAATQLNSSATQINGTTCQVQPTTLQLQPVNPIQVLREIQMNSQKITGMLDPVSSQDATTKSYVDAQVGGASIVKPLPGLGSYAITSTTQFPSSSTGLGNILYGDAAGDNLTSGSLNIALGNFVARNMTTAQDNVIIGDAAGLTLTSGTRNILLGGGANVSSNIGSNRIAIGNSASCDTDKHMTIGAASTARRIECWKPGSDNHTDLGEATRQFKDIYFSGELVATGAAANVQVREIATSSLACGFQAGNQISSGTNNFAFGYLCGSSIKTGQNNTYLGASAGRTANGAIGTHSNNTGFGARAMNYMGGGGNVAVGSGALESTIAATYQDCVAVGASAMGDNVSGNQSIAIGRSAMALTVSTSDAVAIGYEAYREGGDRGVVIGSEAGRFASGTDAVYIGFEAGKGAAGLSTGNGLVGIGTSALKSATSLFATVAVGGNAAQNLTSGSYNVCVGASSMVNATTAARNTCVGFISGRDLTTGSENTMIGNFANPSSGSTTNAIALGSNAIGEDNTFIVGNTSNPTTSWLPATDDQTDLGSSTRAFKNVYAGNMIGYPISFGCNWGNIGTANYATYCGTANQGGNGSITVRNIAVIPTDGVINRVSFVRGNTASPTALVAEFTNPGQSPSTQFITLTGTSGVVSFSEFDAEAGCTITLRKIGGQYAPGNTSLTFYVAPEGNALAAVNSVSELSASLKFVNQEEAIDFTQVKDDAITDLESKAASINAYLDEVKADFNFDSLTEIVANRTIRVG